MYCLVTCDGFSVEVRIQVEVREGGDLLKIIHCKIQHSFELPNIYGNVGYPNPKICFRIFKQWLREGYD